jgi:hypothetical protein
MGNARFKLATPIKFAAFNSANYLTGQAPVKFAGLFSGETPVKWISYFTWQEFNRIN